MPGMKRMDRMVPMMKKGGDKYGYSKGGGKNAGAKALMKKFKEMGIAKMGNGEKLLQAAMGNGEGIDLSAVAETSMQYGGGFMPKDVTEMRYGGGTSNTYSGPKKAKKAKKAKKGRKK